MQPDFTSYINGWEQRLILRFPYVKLTDFQSRWAELEASDNPFALVVMAHIKAMETQKKYEERYHWKLELVEMAYNKGYSLKDIYELFRFIDWVLYLPPDLKRKFTQSLGELEEKRATRYITSVEQVGIEKGIIIGEERGIEKGIFIGEQKGERKHAVASLLTLWNARFLEIPQNLSDRLGSITDLAVLNSLLVPTTQVASVEEFEKLLPDMEVTEQVAEGQSEIIE